MIVHPPTLAQSTTTNNPDGTPGNKGHQMNASEIAATAAAVVSIGGAIGAVGKFIWDKIENRFKAIERELDECRERSDLSEKRRNILITIIEVLKQEFRHHLPNENEALCRADELMEEYRSLKPSDKLADK